MADRLDSERLRGFDFRRTDRQTDEQTFAIVESLLRLKTDDVFIYSQESEVDLSNKK